MDPGRKIGLRPRARQPERPINVYTSTMVLPDGSERTPTYQEAYAPWPAIAHPGSHTTPLATGQVGRVFSLHIRPTLGFPTMLRLSPEVGNEGTFRIFPDREADLKKTVRAYPSDQGVCPWDAPMVPGPTVL